MAMTKCKECGESISTKSEACPKCGAKRKKKTSLFTWLVLILIIAAVWGSINAPKNSTSSTEKSSTVSATTGTKQKEKPKPATKKVPAWYSFESKDEMTGEMSAYAVSPKAYPTKTMKFPYSSTTSNIGIGCDKKSEWIYFKFNQSPNLVNSETKDGYNLIKTRIKFDDKVENIELTQTWSAESMQVSRSYKNKVLDNLKTANTVLLELDWSGSIGTLFKYSLKGSSNAISEMRATCKK